MRACFGVSRLCHKEFIELGMSGISPSEAGNLSLSPRHCRFSHPGCILWFALKTGTNATLGDVVFWKGVSGIVVLSSLGGESFTQRPQSHEIVGAVIQFP